MNPYEATLPNVISRVLAWVRGLLRLYRRPLMVAAGAALLVAFGASGAFAPATSEAAPVVAISPH